MGSAKDEAIVHMLTDRERDTDRRLDGLVRVTWGDSELVAFGTDVDLAAFGLYGGGLSGSGVFLQSPLFLSAFAHLQSQTGGPDPSCWFTSAQGRSLHKSQYCEQRSLGGSDCVVTKDAFGAAGAVVSRISESLACNRSGERWTLADP